jgi:pimeloyl-ACP methyl ester carboxylesterase
MRKLRNFCKSMLIAGLLLPGTSAMAPEHAAPAVKNIVLVHGAFADGSSWSKVIPLLEAKGFHVSAVGNPLTSYADDLAATKRQIALQDGPTILVGHSYAGVVITEAGVDPKVVGLVYVAAFAPDSNQSINDVSANAPKPPGLSEIKPLTDGFIMLSADGIANDFAQDLSPSEKRLISAAQPQTSGGIFDAKPAGAAWRVKPSWFVVAANDRMISPELERGMAKHINATMTEVQSSHVAMLAQPAKVAKVIADAAGQSLATKR